MKKYILSLALVATCALAGELKYQEIDGFLSPESVFIDKTLCMFPMSVKNLSL